MNNIVIIESILARPHLETAGEIALRFKRDLKHKDVKFVWIGKDIPFTDWDFPIFFKLFRYYLIKRLRIFKNLLRINKIKILPCPDLELNNLIYINKWINSFSGENLNQLRDYKYKGYSLGRGVASSLVSYFRDVNLDLLKHKNLVKSLLFSSAIIFERCNKIIKSENPKTIITFNGRFSISLPIVLLAKKYNIKLLRHERGCDFNRFELFKENIHNPKNRAKAVFNYWKKKSNNKYKIAKNFFYQRRFKNTGLGITLGYSYTKEQKRNYIREDIIKLSYKKRLVVYFTSSDHEQQAELYDTDQENKFKSLISAISLFNDIHLIIRVHPGRVGKDSAEDLNWNRYSSSNVSIVSSNDNTDTYKLLDIAEIVVTYGSNIIIESLFWKKKSILLNNNTAYYQFNSRIYPKNNRELKKFLNKDYRFKRILKKECLPYGYYFKIFGIPYKYYAPKNHFDGSFLKVDLNTNPKIFFLIKNILPNKIYNFFYSILKKFYIFFKN